MSDERTKIVDKIRKLFALGRSSNQHEAEAALAKANQLLQEHQLSMSEVEIKEEGGVKTNVHSMGRVRSRSKFVWDLAHSCAELYDCTTLRHKGRDTWSLSYIGRANDIEMAKQTFQYLYTSWEAISKNDYKLHGYGSNSKLFKNSHLAGFSRAIGQRVIRLVYERQQALRKANTTGTALVLIKGKEVADYVKEKFVVREERSRDRNIDSSAFNAGRERGNAIPLGGAIDEQKKICDN